jgi:hypothetical protein
MIPNKVAEGGWSQRLCEDSVVGCLSTMLVSIGVVILIATDVLPLAGVGFLLVVIGVMSGLARWSDRWRSP